MGRKKNGKKEILTTKTSDHALNLPTVERMLKGDVRIRSNAGLVDEPMRIDKLLNNRIIDEMQHLYGIQITTYWMIANRPFMRTASYEQRVGKVLPGFDYINISRMSAKDKFYKTMEFLDARDRALISKIYFEEMGAIEAGRSLGLPVNSITVYVRAAFDALGNALTTHARLQKGKRKAGKNRRMILQAS